MILHQLNKLLRATKVRDLLVISMGRGLQIVFAVVSVRFTTFILPPSEMGRLRVLTTIGALSTMILVVPVASYWNRRIHSWRESGHLSKMASLFCGYLVVFVVPVTLILIAFDWCIGFGIQISPAWLVCVVFCSLVVTSVGKNFVSSLNLLNYRYMYVLLANLILWGGLLCSIWLTKNFEVTAEWWFLGSVAVPLVLTGVVLPSVMLLADRNRRPQSVEIAAELNRLWSFSSPLLLYSVVYFAQSQSYPFVFSAKSSAVALGLFTVGLNIGANPMQMFNNMLMEYYSPVFYESLTKEGSKQYGEVWNEYARSLIPASIAFGLFIIAVSSVFVKLLVGPEYSAAGWLAGWGVLREMMVVCYSLLNLGAQAVMQTRLMLFPTILGAATTLGLLFLLLPLEPLVGGAIALVIGAAVNVAGMVWNVRQSMPIVAPWRRMLVAIALSLPVFGIVCCVERLLPDNSWGWLGVLTTSGVYAVAVQVMLAWDWLFGKGIGSKRSEVSA